MLISGYLQRRTAAGCKLADALGLGGPAAAGPLCCPSMVLLGFKLTASTIADNLRS